jgi:hypothetical protein
MVKKRIIIVLILLSTGFSLFQVDIVTKTERKTLTEFSESLSREHLSRSLGCHVVHRSAMDYSNCQLNKYAAGKPVFLIGDSHADALAEGLLGAANLLNRPLFLRTASSCIFFPGGEIISPKKNDPFFPWIMPNLFDHCEDYFLNTQNWLQSMPSGTIVITQNDQVFWDENFGLSYNKQTSYNQEEKIGMFSKSLKKFILEMKRIGHKVVVVQTVPTFRNPLPIWEPDKCNRIQIQNQNCSRAVSMSDLDSFQWPLRALYFEFKKDKLIELVDFRGAFCSEQQCSSVKNGFNQYRDATHISVEASKALAPTLVNYLTSIKK